MKEIYQTTRQKKLLLREWNVNRRQYGQRIKSQIPMSSPSITENTLTKEKKYKNKIT